MTDRTKATRAVRMAALMTALGLTAAACGAGGDEETVAAAEVVAPADATDDAEEPDAMEDEGEDADAMEDEGEDADAMEDEGEDADAMEDEGEDADADADAMEDGEDGEDGEAMAEGDGVLTVTIENVSGFPIGDSGVFNTPVGASDPAPALPGDAYEFSVYAQPGDRLSFATMLVQTNDWFVAPLQEGIELFDADGYPIEGDITDQLYVFDGGTEIDQPFGEGADQAPRQAGPDTGDADPDNTVRRLDDRSARDYVGVLITPGENGVFNVRIQNDSAMAVIPTPIAPGVYAAHTPDVALFEVGSPDPGQGLEALAEDGDPAPLAETLAGLTGTRTPISPGAYAAHSSDVAFFELGGVDAGIGLEGIAEDGDPAAFAEALADLDAVSHSGAFTNPDEGEEPGPALPGSSYTFTVPYAEGEQLSFATMFVQSNDWIISTPAEGLDPASLDGDITDQLVVVDVGTEIDQRPGSGPDQAPRQAGPDTGDVDPDTTVRIVDGRSAPRYVKVTVTK